MLKDAIRLVGRAFASFDVNDVAAGYDAHRQRIADHAQKLIAAAEKPEGLVAIVERQGDGSFAVHVLLAACGLA
ncbi:MAG: hypothetical protein HY040_15700 [Planctomycetes bacterium]|nr:hypothetical protein [Planctomycetota bacterium]